MSGMTKQNSIARSFPSKCFFYPSKVETPSFLSLETSSISSSSAAKAPSAVCTWSWSTILGDAFKCGNALKWRFWWSWISLARFQKPPPPGRPQFQFADLFGSPKQSRSSRQASRSQIPNEIKWFRGMSALLSLAISTASGVDPWFRHAAHPVQPLSSMGPIVYWTRLCSIYGRQFTVWVLELRYWLEWKDFHVKHFLAPVELRHIAEEFQSQKSTLDSRYLWITAKQNSGGETVLHLMVKACCSL